MGSKLDAKNVSFGGPSWAPFRGGLGALLAPQSIFFEAQADPPEEIHCKTQIFFPEGEGFGGANLALKKIALRRPGVPKTPPKWTPT